MNKEHMKVAEGIAQQFDERYSVDLFGENPIVEREIENRKEYLIRGKWISKYIDDNGVEVTIEPNLRVSDTPVKNDDIWEENLESRDKTVTVQDWRLNASIKKFISQAIAQSLSDLEEKTERKTAEDIHRKQESDFENSGCVNEACRHCELWDESIQAIKSKYLNQARKGGEK